MHLPLVLLLPSLAILASPSLSCMSIVSVTCCFLSTQTSIYLEKRWFDFGVSFLGCVSSLDIERSLPTWLHVVFFQFGFSSFWCSYKASFKFRIRVFFLDEMSSKTDEPHLSKALVFNLPLFLFLSVVAVLNVIYMYMYLSISINKSYKKEISIICNSKSLPFTIIDKGKAKQTLLCISSGKKVVVIVRSIAHSSRLCIFMLNRSCFEI